MGAFANIAKKNFVTPVVMFSCVIAALHMSARNASPALICSFAPVVQNARASIAQITSFALCVANSFAGIAETAIGVVPAR